MHTHVYTHTTTNSRRPKERGAMCICAHILNYTHLCTYINSQILGGQQRAGAASIFQPSCTILLSECRNSLDSKLPPLNESRPDSAKHVTCPFYLCALWIWGCRVHLIQYRSRLLNNTRLFCCTIQGSFVAQ